MGDNYVLLERVTLNATASSVTFSNIPQTGYTDLKVVVSARSARTNDAGGSDGKLEFNGITTGYTGKILTQQGAAYSNSVTSLFYFVDSNNSTSNTFGNMEVYIPNYTSSNPKSVSIDGVSENNGTSAYQVMTAGLWTYTGNPAITSLKFTDNNGGFLQYSTFSIYGLAAVGTTPALLPFASGGDIIQNDGTYWYHAFLSSGSFTPAKALSCDILQVAGGGGGAGTDGGGGGAGGLLAFTSQSLTANTSLTATIGAGGTAGVVYAAGTSGSNSQFASLTASVGGGRGGSGSTPIAGATGGSGGGGAGGTGSGAGAGGSATSGQGNAGGSGSLGSNGSGGGGGGAGSSGANAVSIVAGNGGAGTNTYSSWLSAVSLGVSGYIAGGGGGGGNSGTAGSAGSGGAGAGGVGGTSNPGGNATANTGSGGGGGANDSAGGAGGSGVIIVRYAMV